ncbi:MULTISPECIES: ubiquinol-cytochrome c reductase iron-sulfur subunit [Alkalihalobacterium]|uniref:Ubiquinol-cytochrome c reductase iron-sulfur subunit n=1 Tax=Alkalihalobacterium chitinilyticum TaxID=2980103 RepID=A0ABT5V8W0_9BACI|nr:ubiquinol-cytochrome c reductase iron-sulfur subunit [Alkalihalobacterium chitinilyticum]MDE5411908.1 ubiquinol-cytochrome c reductase iron-sulfur subunit [Alkalihalobacterium chitinilyticum]MEB1806826.1 ubiquinol-cytochrome c reductase iron-sulfur subunit [Bacillaceae bacterium]
MSEKDHKVSRRQFLTYTLTGVGGFMAAGMIMPMARFALDPALKVGAESDMVPINLHVDEVTSEPIRKNFQFEQVDAWYTSEVTGAAWVFRQGDEIIALSPVCTHLGCTVDWNTNPDFENQFFCPCHFGRFELDGTNVAGTPPTRPLDVYELEVRDGYIYLGRPIRRG